MNIVFLWGNVGQDPKHYVTPGKREWCQFDVATREFVRFSPHQKKPARTTIWHRCKAFGQPAAFTKDWVRQGSQVFIQGKCAYRKMILRDTGREVLSRYILATRISLSQRSDEILRACLDHPDLPPDLRTRLEDHVLKHPLKSFTATLDEILVEEPGEGRPQNPRD